MECGEKMEEKITEQYFIAANPFVAYKGLDTYDLLEIVFQQIKK